MYRKILIPTDGSELANKAAEHGIELAKGLGASVFAVFVVDTRALPAAHPIVPETMAPYYVSLIDELRKMGEKAVFTVAEAAQKAGVQVKTEVLDGIPSQIIIDVARREKVDLIVMGTHGRSGIAAMLLGSTAGNIVHKADTPVLVVRG